jgi:CheY-like chemotaxis protein
MALFGFGKDKKDAGGGADQVLAYLEDAQRTRASFTLVGPRKVEATAVIQGIDEGGGLVTFQLASPLSADKGVRIELLFSQESLRIGGTATVAETRPGVLVATLPESLELRERRRQPRARLNPKEGATLTALTGLFEGVGITGVIENLSEGGARVRVEKAINIKGEKRLPLGSGLVPVGQPFMLVKLNKVPKCPAAMELEGRAVYLDTSGGGLVLGLSFAALKPDVASAVRNLVSSRTTATPSSLPNKARRRPEAAPARPPEPAPDHAPARPAPAAPRNTAPAGEAPEAAPAREAEPAQAPPAPEAEEPEAPAQAAAARNDTMLRLRKRARAVVALVPGPAAADLLRDFLLEDGYVRALVTTSPDELEEHLQQPNLGVLLVDSSLGTLAGLKLVSNLRAQFPALPPVILAVEEASTGIVLAAHRQGAAQVLVKPYALDESFSDLLARLLDA